MIPILVTSRCALFQGDSKDLGLVLGPNTVDAIVTDPPCGIGFMGREWDSDKGGRDQWVTWLADILRPAFVALKPGGHALVWGIPRTMHWTMLALELAGFEIRDVVHHAFGTGFPKSLNVSKAIDASLGKSDERPVVGSVARPGFKKGRGHGTDESGNPIYLGINGGGHNPTVDLDVTSSATAAAAAAAWEGWGTALKPALEPWILARKPLGTTVAKNVMEHGTGALNIDGCRIGDAGGSKSMPGAKPNLRNDVYGEGMGGIPSDPNAKLGRWPAHLVLSHHDECAPIGEAADTRVVRVGESLGADSRDLAFGMGRQDTTTTTTTTTVYECHPDCAVRLLDAQNPGASRFFYCAKPSKAETELGLDHLQPMTGGELTDREDGSAGLNSPRAGAGRKGGARNFHPTKKPVELMRYLCRLITPPGGLVIDLFGGSGTTGVAALQEGFEFLGVEQNPDYIPIIKGRLEHALSQTSAATGIDAPTDTLHEDT